MKTKIIPFDAKMAKDIQDGKIEGKIVRKCNPKQVCEILEFDAKYQDKCGENFLIVKIPAHDFEKEKLWIYHQDGRAMHSSSYEKMWFDLVLEVPDNVSQFKPFDKVLCRDCDSDEWQCDLFSHIQDDSEQPYVTIGHMWSHCIQYEGHEYLLGTTDKPKEE